MEKRSAFRLANCHQIISELILCPPIPTPKKANMKHKLISFMAAATLFNSAWADDALQSAIKGPQRSAANVVRDVARHPYETLTFFGIRPDMTVVELSPGGGWYTEILAPYLRDKGQLIEAHYDPASSVPYQARDAKKFKDKLAAEPTVYDKVQMSVFDVPDKLDIAPKGTADMVLTFRNVHNWAAIGDTAVLTVFKAVYESLKPGGVFGVVDHRLPVAMAQDAKASSGYLHESYVIKLAEAAGFKLAAKSEVNANPKDTADYPDGVWTLPPSYFLKDKDRARYAAIGESDRFTLRFVRP